MSRKQGANRLTSKRGMPAGNLGVVRTAGSRVVLFWLVVLIVVLAAPAAGGLAAPSNEDPAGGSSAIGLTANLSQVDSGARASPEEGRFSAWFTDPGEWFSTSPSPLAGTGSWNEAAGSYSALRLAAAGKLAETASTVRLDPAAGSYSELRLAAAGKLAETASTARLDPAAGSYSELRLAASQAGGEMAIVWSESSWLSALSDACAEPGEDPVSGAWSPAEAEFHDSQCSVKGAAFLMGSGGTHRQ
jgi:hypothetical protein